MSDDRLPCGCYAIRLCPLHQAAPALLAACEAAADYWRDTDAPILRMLQNAIAKAVTP